MSAAQDAFQGLEYTIIPFELARTPYRHRQNHRWRTTGVFCASVLCSQYHSLPVAIEITLTFGAFSASSPVARGFRLPVMLCK